MTTYVLTFLLLSTGSMQVAVQAPNGEEFTQEFSNTDAGAQAFSRWLVSEAHASPETEADSCLATQNEGDVPLYDSPFLKLAAELQGNSATWSEARFAHTYPKVPASERTAKLMLQHCRGTFLK